MAAGHWQQRGRQDNGCDQAKPSSLLASASKTRNESGPPSALGADRAADAVRVESASRRYWHDPDRKPGLPANLRANSHTAHFVQLGNKEDAIPHLFAGNLLASRPRRSLASHTIVLVRRRHWSKASTVS